MTPLYDRLVRRITLDGPISVADYMATCLGDSGNGYYTTRDPLGRDFITAPEVSQMFGELIGLWCLAAHEAMGNPAAFHLVELGPGRGTLMADLLRAARVRSAVAKSAKVHLVETSPVLRQRQAEALDSLAKPVWHDTVSTLPDGPMIVIANEFFDALPTRQYQKTETGWRERLIGLDDAGRLIFGLSPADIDPRQMPPGEVPLGTIYENAPAQVAVMAELSQKLRRSGGVMLLIDYGHLQPGFGDTLQAVRAHQYDDVLAHPGDADLTTHVDFSLLAATAMAAGLHVAGRAEQGDFLLNMGLLQRAGVLGADKDEATRDKIRAAVERLAGPEEMGRLFKVLAISSGFELPGFA